MKKPWTRAEKSLFLTPMLGVLLSGGLWLWRHVGPFSIALPPKNMVNAVEFSPDGKRLVVFFKDFTTSLHAAQVYDLTTRTKVCDLTIPTSPTLPNQPPGNRDYFYWPSWSPDGTRIVAGYSDNTQGTTKIPYPVMPSPKFPRFHFNNIGKFVLWDAQNGRLDGKYLYAPTNEESFGAVHFSSDGKMLVGAGNPASLFDADTGKRLRVFKGSFARAYSSKLNKDLGLLAVISKDLSRFQVYDTKTNRMVWEPHIGTIFKYEWSGSVLGAIDWGSNKPKRRSGSSRVLLWDGKTRSVFPAPPLPIVGPVLELGLSPDKTMVAFFNCQMSSPSKTKKSVITGELVVWDYRHHRRVWSYSTTSILTSVHWSPNGKWLSAVTSYLSEGVSPVPEQHVLVFDRTGKLHLDQKMSDQLTRWSPDSTHLATVSQTRDVWRSTYQNRINLIRFRD